MKNLLLFFIVMFLTAVSFANTKATQPLKVISTSFLFNIVEPCTATISDSRTFYKYNCGGNNYYQTLTASCTRSAPTCSEAMTSAVNCMDRELSNAGTAWKKQITDANCPETVIDWID